MGLLKGHIQDWLENYGYELGFDFYNLPDLSDMTSDCPSAEEYYGNTN